MARPSVAVPVSPNPYRSGSFAMAASDFRLDRRSFLRNASTGAAALTLGGTWPGRAFAQTDASAVDHTIRIASASVELAPGRSVRTFAYNGQVPGPLLRLQQGRPVSIKVINDTDR